MKNSQLVGILVMTLLWGGAASARTWPYSQGQLQECKGDMVCAECRATLLARPGAYPSQEACEQASRSAVSGAGLKTCSCKKATFVEGMMGQGGIRYSAPYSSYPIPESQACSSLNQTLQGGGSITCEYSCF